MTKQRVSTSESQGELFLSDDLCKSLTQIWTSNDSFCNDLGGDRRQFTEAMSSKPSIAPIKQEGGTYLLRGAPTFSSECWLYSPCSNTRKRQRGVQNVLFHQGVHIVLQIPPSKRLNPEEVVSRGDNKKNGALHPSRAQNYVFAFFSGVDCSKAVSLFFAMAKRIYITQSHCPLEKLWLESLPSFGPNYKRRDLAAVSTHRVTISIWQLLFASKL